jgi:hypothetical protein
MGLFFVRKSRYREVIAELEKAESDRDYWKKLRDEGIERARLVNVENKKLREAITASREAFDKALPVTVVHTWTTA